MICETCQGVFKGHIELFEAGIRSMTEYKTHHATRASLLVAIEEHCQICTVILKEGYVETVASDVEPNLTRYMVLGPPEMDTTALERSVHPEEL